MQSNETAHAGLPTADDYDPDAIGNAQLSAGEPEQTWPEFGLELVPVLHGGDDTGRRLVRRNGNYISDVSDRYKLLPNEQVVQAANNVAQELGAEPFHEFDGDWFVNLDDHVYQDTERRRVHALYAWEQGSVAGDEMEYGFSVHNSIDGSQSFDVSLFTFRHACANMVHIGAGTARDRMAQNVESERGVVVKESHRHTSGLEVDEDSLTALVQGTLTFVDNVSATYEQWAEEFIEPEVALDLAERLPDKDLPHWLADAVEEFDAVEENESLTPMEVDERKESIIRQAVPSSESHWTMYNDVTEAIWHSNTTSDTSKRRKMKNLHRAMQPGV